jgi:ABC-type cobalamin transport system ATPase subunit
VLRTAQQVAPANLDTVVYTRLATLPHFNPDDDHEPWPSAVAELRAAVRNADALLLCTPEYAGDMHGSLKNLPDEPSAGLDAAETEQVAAHLRQLRDEGVSLLVVDHELDFITGLCDRVAVFELGHLVAVGPAETTFADQRVVDTYLGVAD